MVFFLCTCPFHLLFLCLHLKFMLWWLWQPYSRTFFELNKLPYLLFIYESLSPLISQWNINEIPPVRKLSELEFSDDVSNTIWFWRYLFGWFVFLITHFLRALLTHITEPIMQITRYVGEMYDFFSFKK